MFIGREKELKMLDGWSKSSKSELIAIYGRRRVGKSYLVKYSSRKSNFLKFEGIESQPTSFQIEQFQQMLIEQINDPLLRSLRFNKWNQIFDYITSYFSQQKSKTIILFDELQWMAVGQSRLVSLIKSYWDNHWKDQKIVLILCGSIASFMIRKVIKSKSLYGRITGEIHLKKMNPDESMRLIPKRGVIERLHYLIILGGVPKYLEHIQQNRSFEDNIKRLFFDKNAIFKDEYQKVFYSHFREPRTYQKIIFHLLKGPLSMEDLSRKMKIPSGGRFKEYLNNLMMAEFIREQKSFLGTTSTKLIKYRIADEYLFFFAKYLWPYHELIQSDGAAHIFEEKIVREWRPWLGIAFENYCLNNAMWIAQKMGFVNKVEKYGSYMQRGVSGVQIDLIYTRLDKVITICEIKFYNSPIGVGIIHEVNKKIEKIKVPKGWTLELALIAPYGADNSVKELDYFHHILTLEDFNRS